ncbi:MAG: hypothetical protein LUE98_12280 [Tannerellaceae bacterium]|nr:hypothetical protein [Tannerellaceae bacterium]
MELLKEKHENLNEQEALFDDIGELRVRVGLVKTKHRHKPGDFILVLKGKVTQEYGTQYVSYGKSPREAA